jgi:hypothetical protein
MHKQDQILIMWGSFSGGCRFGFAVLEGVKLSFNPSINRAGIFK